MLQLQPSFNMKVLKALFIPKLVEKVVDKMVEEVATSRGATLKVDGMSGGEAIAGAKALAKAPKIAKIKNADES